MPNRIRVAHICNLIAMALRDNDFEDEEKKSIIKIATRLGICVADIENVLNKSSIELQVPERLSERIQHLHDLVMVMMADGILHKEEIKYISFLTKAYGLDDKYDGNPVTINLDKMKEHLSFQRFIKDFKKITADELSSIVIDSDFNIKFPLYNTELKNLGPLPKTLYLFFLHQSDPIFIHELSSEKNKETLRIIYSMMPNSDYNVKEKIDSLTDPLGLTFNSNRSLIKRSIVNSLPKHITKLSEHYLISGQRNQPKKIILNKDLVTIPGNLYKKLKEIS